MENAKDAVEIKSFLLASHSKVNPLICPDRGSEHVESILGLLQFLMLDAADDSLVLSYENAHGLAILLDTCQAALRIMRNDGEVDPS
jgi:hypothetical protein